MRSVALSPFAALAALSLSCAGSLQSPLTAAAPAETAPISEPATGSEELAAAELAPTAEPDDRHTGESDGLESASPEKEALQHCQRAEELLDAGDAAGALTEVDAAYEALLAAPAREEESEQAGQDIRLLVARLIGRIYGGPAPRGATASSDLGLAMADNEHVQREIVSLTTVERDELIAGYRRSGRYRPMILKQLEEAGLPSQLSWLPLVESWFKVHALSRASALGLWQFISSTGLRYGLKVDRFIDERLDPEKSTTAAISYLSDLHQLFGDWPKALAAYNCGEGSIKRLQRSEEQFVGFWDMYGYLPNETRRYLPRLIAMVQIVENPAKYGIELPEPDPPAAGLAKVEITTPVKLAALDEALVLPAGTLALLNPELRHQATPDHAYSLRVPAEHADKLAPAVAKLPKWEPPKVEYVVHRVRRGETLSGIAEHYRTSISAIMRANGLRSANRIWPGQRLRIPVRG